MLGSEQPDPVANEDRLWKQQREHPKNPCKERKEWVGHEADQAAPPVIAAPAAARRALGRIARSAPELACRSARRRPAIRRARLLDRGMAFFERCASTRRWRSRSLDPGRGSGVTAQVAVPAEVTEPGTARRSLSRRRLRRRRGQARPPEATGGARSVRPSFKRCPDRRSQPPRSERVRDRPKLPIACRGGPGVRLKFGDHREVTVHRLRFTTTEKLRFRRRLQV